MAVSHSLFLGFFVYFFHRINNLVAFVESAFRASDVRSDHCSAMGAFDQTFFLELQIDSRPVAASLCVFLLLYRHKFEFSKLFTIMRISSNRLFDKFFLPTMLRPQTKHVVLYILELIQTAPMLLEHCVAPGLPARSSGDEFRRVRVFAAYPYATASRSLCVCQSRIPDIFRALEASADRA